jgi:hypothetical protein
MFVSDSRMLRISQSPLDLPLQWFDQALDTSVGIGSDE